VNTNYNIWRQISVLGLKDAIQRHSSTVDERLLELKKYIRLYNLELLHFCSSVNFCFSTVISNKTLKGKGPMEHEKPGN